MAGFDVDAARKAGYSDADIANYLGQENGFDVQGARQAGYSDGDIIGHLSGAADQPSAADQRREMPKPLRMLDAGVRGAADMLSFGFADEGAAAMDALPELLKGPSAYGKAYQDFLAQERAKDAADQQDVPVSRGVGETAGFAGGLGVGAIADAGRLVPTLTRPGALRVVENVLKSGGAGGVYGGLAGAGNADGDVGQRVQAAIPSAVVGAGIGAASAPVMDFIGTGIRAMQTRNASPLDRAANVLRGRFDVPTAQDQANALRQAGAIPTAVSAMDEAGRGYVRAAASRMTPGREIVQQRAEGAALNLPDRIAMQARAHISPNPTDADTIVQRLEQARDRQATTDYAQPYSQLMQVPDDVKDMLRDPAGQSIIARARADAIENQDWPSQMELDSLTRPTQDGQLPQVSGRTLDRLAIAARERGNSFAESGRNYRARGSFGRQDQINGVLDNTPGLAGARGAYADASRNIEAAQAADNFLQPGSADEFGRAMTAATDLGPARDVAARAVIRQAGENPSAAPGVARKLAFAPEQQSRNAALLQDPAAAQRMQDSMAAEARTVRDLGDVAPRTGPQTFNRGQDAEQIGAAVDLAHAIMTGGKSVVVGLINRLKTAGISDADAHAVADIATDPTQLDALLNRMEQMRPGYGGALRSIIRQSVVKDAGEMTQPPVMMTDAAGNSYGFDGKIIGPAK